jgi:hypothetical protein
VRLLRDDKLMILAADDSRERLASSLQLILKAIPEVVVAGISTVSRAVIQSEPRAAPAPGVLVFSISRCSSPQECPTAHVAHSAVCWCCAVCNCRCACALLASRASRARLHAHH